MQKEATWRGGEKSFTCYTVTHYDGEYQCKGTATTAGDTATTASNVTIVKTHCMFNHVVIHLCAKLE